MAGKIISTGQAILPLDREDTIAKDGSYEITLRDKQSKDVVRRGYGKTREDAERDLWNQGFHMVLNSGDEKHNKKSWSTRKY